MGGSVTGCEDDLAVALAIWQAPGALTSQHVLNHTVTSN